LLLYRSHTTWGSSTWAKGCPGNGEQALQSFARHSTTTHCHILCWLDIVLACQFAGGGGGWCY
jgi:hypothetical protein